MTKHTITIDLTKDLTIDRIKEALPHMKACKYSAPCIIGSMIPVELRAALDDTNNKEDSPNVGSLLLHDVLVFAHPNQAFDAASLQRTFDAGRRAEFLEACSRYCPEALTLIEEDAA